MKNTLINFFSHWVIGLPIAFGFVSLGTIGAYALPTIYKEIKLDGNIFLNLSSLSIIYILLIFFIITIYSIRQACLSLKVEMKEKELNRSIQTFPPYEVTREFEKIIKIMAQYDEKLGNSSDQLDSRKVYVRVCLDAIANIARLFHNASNGHRFAANIMGRVSTDNLIKDTSKSCYLLKFTDHGKLEEIKTNIPDYLALIPELSSATDVLDKESIDDEIQSEEILLPLPSRGETLLPGAPSAYYNSNAHDLVSNCQTIFKGVSYPKLSNNVKSTLDNYFNNGQGRNIGSVLSIRLTDENDDKALGVVNIHSDINDMFTNLDKRMMFMQLISPIMYKMYRLLTDK